jgi:hypothetical protein
MKAFQTLLLLAIISPELHAQTVGNQPPISSNDLPAEVSLRMRASDPVGFCSPAAYSSGTPSILLSAESFGLFACDPVRQLWIATAAPADTRSTSVAVTEYGYVQGTNCNPTGTPGCNVFPIAQLTGAGTILKVQATMTQYSPNDLISFQCDGEVYPGENTSFATFFVEALQSTDWKTRNVGGNVAPDGFGSYRNLMIPFSSGCTVNITNNASVNSQVFAQVEYASGKTPASLTGGVRNHYHIAHDDATNITPYAVHTCLNYSGGPGEIESVVSTFLPEYPALTYLEGDPTFITDGSTTFYYGGTEDFFGSQWYFQSLEDTSVSDEWGSPNVVQSAGAVQAFRFFTGPRQTYTKVTWNNSVIFNQPNGAAGQGPVEPAPLNHDCLVTFWTVK